MPVQDPKSMLEHVVCHACRLLLAECNVEAPARGDVDAVGEGAEHVDAVMPPFVTSNARSQVRALSRTEMRYALLIS